jgi:peptide/nickel transport system substrate-binding protein
MGVSIDGVLISQVPTESLIGALQTDQVDFFQHGLVTLDTVAAIEALPNASTHIYRSNGYIHLQFNTKKPHLSDVRVRQALMYALDRKSFVEIQYGEGLAEVAPSVFSPVSWATPPLGELNMYDFDLAKAEALMNEAGWFKGTDGILEKDGEKFKLTWYVYEDAPWPATLAGIASDHWKQLGVDLTIELMDFVTTIARTTDLPLNEERTFDIYTMGFSLSIDPDPSGALWDPEAWTVGGFNGSGYDNPRASELIALGKNTFDQAERMAYYQEFAKLLNEDVPGTPLAYRSELWGINNRVSGMKEIGPFLRWSKPVVIRGITLN